MKDKMLFSTSRAESFRTSESVEILKMAVDDKLKDISSIISLNKNKSLISPFIFLSGITCES